MTSSELQLAWQVFLYGLATALATGLGALPFAFVKEVSPRLVSTANAIASGLMLGACFSLVAEGTRHGVWATLIGANLGVVFIVVTNHYLDLHEVEFAQLRGAGARHAILIVVVMTVHSFSEGIAVGASFAGGMRLAVFITVAIAVHNVPEGLAISAVLRARGVSLPACAGWSILSSLPQPLMAVPAALFVETFRPALPYCIGFAAGAMVYMVFVELLPEAYEHSGRTRVATAASLALVAMFLFQRYL